MEDDISKKFNLDNSGDLASRVLNQFFGKGPGPQTGKDQLPDELDALMQPAEKERLLLLEEPKAVASPSPEPEIEFPLLEDFEKCSTDFREALMLG